MKTEIEIIKGLLELMMDKTVGKVNPDDHGSGLAVTTYQFNSPIAKEALKYLSERNG